MILTDEEIEAMFAKANDGYVGVMQNDVNFARAIEAAIMAKLASAELPEPTVYSHNVQTHMNVLDAYSADQLRQAYAQGAAAQLSAEPEWYVYRVNNSGWGCVPASYVPHKDVYDEGTLTPLYTRRQA